MADFDERVGDYLDKATSSGGGTHAVNHYSMEIFKKDFTDLTQKEKDTVYTACFHDYTWLSDTSPGVMGCFAASANACLKTVEIDPNSPAGDRGPVELEVCAHVNRNAHAGMLFAKLKGLEALLAEDNEYSVERRYFQHIVGGKFKNDKVFTGIIQAKVMATDREIRGKGMQNFKYDTDMDAAFGLIHTICLRAYRELQKHFPMRSMLYPRLPGFPIGIAEETFVYAKEYVENYKYPLGAPFPLP
ncbi:hypothetical protein B0H14DRAFT_3461731 [Mycena olivaceomarginata]|nr:hypothetical protein B0H14DRAFT_3461731 [Mycena olivaceomarginata]